MFSDSLLIDLLKSDAIFIMIEKFPCFTCTFDELIFITTKQCSHNANS